MYFSCDFYFVNSPGSTPVGVTWEEGEVPVLNPDYVRYVFIKPKCFSVFYKIRVFLRLQILVFLSNKGSFFNPNFVDKGVLGLQSGQGYFQYPDPSYQAPDFLDVPDISKAKEIALLAKLN